MDEKIKPETIDFDDGTTNLNNQNLRINNQQPVKRNMTSYSFVRNNEESNNVGSPSSPQNVTEKPPGQSYIQMPSQLNQVYQTQYGQIPSQMMMGFGNPLLGYQHTMLAPTKSPKPII